MESLSLWNSSRSERGGGICGKPSPLEQFQSRPISTYLVHLQNMDVKWRGCIRGCFCASVKLGNWRSGNCRSGEMEMEKWKSGEMETGEMGIWKSRKWKMEIWKLQKRNFYRSREMETGEIEK